MSDHYGKSTALIAPLDTRALDKQQRTQVMFKTLLLLASLPPVTIAHLLMLKAQVISIQILNSMSDLMLNSACVGHCWRRPDSEGGISSHFWSYVSFLYDVLMLQLLKTVAVTIWSGTARVNGL